MKALASDRHRAFVLALYQIKPGYGAHVRAAKLAGFGTTTSSAKSWSVIASRLAHDEKILPAIREEDEKADPGKPRLAPCARFKASSRIHHIKITPGRSA